MIRILFTVIIISVYLTGCNVDYNNDHEEKSKVIYNIIEPGNGIYVVRKKNVKKSQLDKENYETIFYADNKVSKIERYNNGNLSDEFSVAAITKFEYNSDGQLKQLKYFDKNDIASEDEIFGYSSIEYIYDEKDRVRMEIYRDKNNKFLEVPVDNYGNIAKVNFISPILTYEYIDDKLKIKALDKNFNLLKEMIGDKPCIPFIDCGENE